MLWSVVQMKAQVEYKWGWPCKNTKLCRSSGNRWKMLHIMSQQAGAAQGDEARRPVQTTVKNGSGHPQKVKNVGLRRWLGWSGIYCTNRTKVLTPVNTNKPSIVCDCSLSRDRWIPGVFGQPSLTNRWAPGSMRDSQRITLRAVRDTQSPHSVQTQHTHVKELRRFQITMCECT